MNTARLNKIYNLPRELLIAIISFMLVYVIYNYFIMYPSFHDFIDIIYYFLPIIILLILLKLGNRHEKFEGILILLFSFFFLGIYHFYIGVTVFLLLALTGLLLLFHANNLPRIRKKAHLHRSLM
jgi:hypothetical protein